MYASFQSWFSKLEFNYFDLIVLAGLAVGVFRGRKHGMSQELLPMLKWVVIVIAAGFLYHSFSLFLRQSIPGAFDLLWGNRTAYILIALGIALVFAWLKKWIGEKLLGSDLFGSAEYYLGMLGGLVRVVCMFVVLISLMNSRIVTKEEIAAEDALQKKNLEDIRLPTYGTIQQAVLFHSFTGYVVKTKMSGLLIMSTTPDKLASGRTPAQRGDDVINQVLGVTNK